MNFITEMLKFAKKDERNGSIPMTAIGGLVGAAGAKELALRLQGATSEDAHRVGFHRDLRDAIRSKLGPKLGRTPTTWQIVDKYKDARAAKIYSRAGKAGLLGAGLGGLAAYHLSKPSK